MKVQDVYVRNDEIAAMQYFMESKDDKTGMVIHPAYFDIILKSGVILHISGSEDIYANAVDQVGID